MIDIHCHLLPGIDDGPTSLDEALAMAESAIGDGVSHVVCTPHASAEYFFEFARVQEAVATLRARLGNRLTLATGCDFHLMPENLVRLRENAAPFCINQRDYLLVEFSGYSIPPSMDQTLHELQLAGLRPIITHPERNAFFHAKPDRLRAWVRHGVFAQVTANALTGGFGPNAQGDAERWIEEGLIHFVASDAHNARGRPLRVRPAYEIVAQRFGEEKARALFVENPLAAFEGRPLPHIPEVAEEVPPRRKRFFFF
jgi:protein-tyrosine phosphatase